MSFNLQDAEFVALRQERIGDSKYFPSSLRPLVSPDAKTCSSYPSQHKTFWVEARSLPLHTQTDRWDLLVMFYAKDKGHQVAAQPEGVDIFTNLRNMG
jgi:hypothetical protein